jgi:hypothetical protein
MRPVKSAMSRYPAKATKALLFKGKSAGALDSLTAHGRQVRQASPEPDSRCRSGHLAAGLHRPECAYLRAQRQLWRRRFGAVVG